MIEIVEVKTKKEQRRFVDFPLKLYKGNKYYLAPFYHEELTIFRPDYVYADTSESAFFNAYKDGKQVGRISVFIQHAANKKWKQKRARFTRFDSIDDSEVAKALFETAENWAKERGMEEIVGPLGYSDFEREGLLIEGFDQLQTYVEQYNYSYYQKLIEENGFTKDVDWVERRFIVPEKVDERIERLAEKVMQRNNLHYVHARNTRVFLDKYADKIYDAVDETYDKIYGTVPMTPPVKKMILENFKSAIDMKYICVVCDENDNLAGFGFVMPSMTKAMTNSDGKLTLPVICRLLYTMAHPDTIDLVLIGVTDEYQAKGVAACVESFIMNAIIKSGAKYCETNLNLEENTAILNMWNRYDGTLNKRRRCFIKKLD